MKALDDLRTDERGLLPAVVQDDANGQVLMVGYMNRQALTQTIRTGRATFWSRSRGKLWVKGETSGHVQLVKSIALDCDQDCVLVVVEQKGVACHTGKRSCFFRELRPDGSLVEN